MTFFLCVDFFLGTPLFSFFFCILTQLPFQFLFVNHLQTLPSLPRSSFALFGIEHPYPPSSWSVAHFFTFVHGCRPCSAFGMQKSYQLTSFLLSVAGTFVDLSLPPPPIITSELPIFLLPPPFPLLPSSTKKIS